MRASSLGALFAHAAARQTVTIAAPGLKQTPILKWLTGAGNDQRVDGRIQVCNMAPPS